jgi:tetratricopeptide (TPR) repeat protein
LETVNNLGAFYTSQDNFVEAEKMYLRALDGFKTTLGPTHSITLSVLINMGSSYVSMDRRHDAVRSYLLALDGYQEVVLRSQNLAQALNTSATADGPVARSSLGMNGHQVMYAQFSGESDEPLSAFIPGLTATLKKLVVLAILHMKNMEWEDAEDVYLRVLKCKELALGSNQPSTLDTIRALAQSLYFHCMLDAAAGPGQTLKPSEMNIGGWVESNPLWRLAHLAETYATSSADVLGVLGKTLLGIGDEENGKTVLRFELVIAANSTGALLRGCDRCKIPITPAIGWYVCRSCTKDTDLCETCFGSRNDEQWQHPCHDHAFEAIISKNLVNDEVLSEYSDPNPWLRSLKAALTDGEHEEQLGVEAREETVREAENKTNDTRPFKREDTVGETESVTNDTRPIKSTCGCCIIL